MWVFFDLNGTLVDPSILLAPAEIPLAALDEANVMAMITTIAGRETAFKPLLDAALRRGLARSGRDPELAATALSKLPDMPAYPDVPGEETTLIDPYEEWLSNDMQGDSDRPDATFIALVDGDVAGYAKLALSKSDAKVAYHDMTGVLRAYRGRGIASALKRTQIRWAKQAGYEKLQTANEVRNAPIRALNQRHGYKLAPGLVTLRDALSGPD